jgi:hypothetical protein
MNVQRAKRSCAAVPDEVMNEEGGQVVPALKHAGGMF